jgi:hypothetical protein
MRRTNGGRSVGMVRWQTKATEFSSTVKVEYASRHSFTFPLRLPAIVLVQAQEQLFIFTLKFIKILSHALALCLGRTCTKSQRSASVSNVQIFFRPHP